MQHASIRTQPAPDQTHRALTLAAGPTGISQLQLARELGISRDHARRLIHTLLQDGRVYESGAPREATYHAERYDLHPHHERPLRIPEVLQVLQRGSNTAHGIASRTGLTVPEASATLERLRHDGLVRMTRIGALRVYERASDAYANAAD